MAKIDLDSTPITVRATKEGFELVTGRHRLEAAKSLDWTEIDAFVMGGGKTESGCG